MSDDHVHTRPRVFRRLLDTAQVPLRPRVLSKGTLTELSHVLENTVIANDLPGAVFTGFQRSTNWFRELERYQRLVAPRARSVAVFAAGNLDTMADDDIVRVPLAEDDPLVEEWFLIVLTPGFCAALLGEETGEEHATELDPAFESVWTLDAATVEAIALHIRDEVARFDPVMAARMETALADYPPSNDETRLRDDVTTDLVIALETGRARLRQAAKRERRAAEQLREVDRSKNAFLAAVSHDLRTPLTVVDGMAATLQRLGGQLSAEDRQRIEEALVTQTGRLSALLDDLLDLDRLARGTAASEPEDLDAATVVQQAIDHLPGAARVELDTPSSLPVHLDRTQLERIVANLVNNAHKYAPEGPINVRLQATAQGLRLTVDDHGPGIPVAQRERILEPFHRLEINRAEPGTGVGLAVVAEFIRLQRGELRVEDRPGGGARFVVLLPSSAAA